MSNNLCKKCFFYGEPRCSYQYNTKRDVDICKYFKEIPQTVFDRITQSPEVLAEKSVYAHECCRIPDGATSPFIDTIFWFEDEKGDTWDERFDSAWEKAITATVAKLKEVCDV